MYFFFHTSEEGVHTKTSRINEDYKWDTDDFQIDLPEPSFGYVQALTISSACLDLGMLMV